MHDTPYYLTSTAKWSMHTTQKSVHTRPFPTPLTTRAAVLLLLRAYLECARAVVAQKDGEGASSLVRVVVQCLWRSGAEETGARVGRPSAQVLHQCERDAERRFDYEYVYR